jgi:hypothetical protein
MLGSAAPSVRFSKTLPAATFVTPAAYGGYLALRQCACNLTRSDVPAGCADACDQSLSGGAVPNLCNGSTATTACGTCLAANCAGQIAVCAMN